MKSLNFTSKQTAIGLVGILLTTIGVFIFFAFSGTNNENELADTKNDIKYSCFIVPIDPFLTT